MRRTGGSRERLILLVAVRGNLQRGQFLRSRDGQPRRSNSLSMKARLTDQAFPFSMISSLTKESRQSSKVTLFRLRSFGTGSERYMKASQVLEDCAKGSAWGCSARASSAATALEQTYLEAGLALDPTPELPLEPIDHNAIVAR